MNWGSALDQRVRRDQSGLRVVLLEVNVGNALHLLGLLLYVKSVLLVVELYVGVVEVELEIMELIP